MSATMDAHLRGPMLCSFCKREEPDVRLECDTCGKKFFICLTCWNGWRGKVTHCGKKLDAKRYLGGNEEHPPLDELLMRAVAAGKKFQNLLTLQMLEPFVCDPIGVYGCAGKEDFEDAFPKFSVDVSVEAARGMTLSAYLAIVAKFNLSSGSCGATSEWLDAVTTMNGISPDPDDIAREALLLLLTQTKAPFYCRISRKPHSFMVECLGDTVRVYQSYFGKYTLSTCLDSMRSMSREAFCADIATSMRETGDAMVVRAAKKRLFLLDVHWSETRIQYRMNTAPARGSVVLANIAKRLQDYRGMWSEALGKTLSELFPDPEPVVFDGPPQGPLQIINTVRTLKLLFEVVPEPLNLGARVSDDALGTYEVTAVDGDQYTVRRI